MEEFNKDIALLLFVGQVILICLRTIGAIHWNWLWVLFPMWVCVAVSVVIVSTTLAAMFILLISQWIKSKRNK